MVVVDLFGISKATVYGTAEAMKVAFRALANFPNVIGCDDCTHLKIPPPAVDEHEWVNPMSDQSIIIQLISDADVRTMKCVVRWPGSIHDVVAKVKTSSLQKWRFP